MSIDSLRADRLGTYGHAAPTSPTIDRLAAGGVVFDRAYTTTSWTLPAHAALFSGLDDLAHGVVDSGYRLADVVTTLAESLSAGGIATTGFYSGPYLHPAFGLAQGFDRYIDCRATAPDPEQSGEPGEAAPGGLQILAADRYVTNPRLLEAIRRWLDDVPRANRNFVFVHMWDVHYDYIPPPEYVELFDPDYRGALDPSGFYFNKAINSHMDRRDLEHVKALYDGEIRYTDDTLGEILALLAATGISERTAVIVVSDHGDEFFEHGGKGHHRTLHEEVLRVPLILHIDGETPARARRDEIVSIIDVYPTVCDLLGTPCPRFPAAQSLLPLYDDRSGASSRNDALAELTVGQTDLVQTALVRPEGKVIRWEKKNISAFFDSEAPGDTKRAIRLGDRAFFGKAAVGHVIAEQLAERNAGARAVEQELHKGVDREAPAPDEGVLRELESLGYMD